MTSDDSDDEPLSKFVSNQKKREFSATEPTSPEPVKRKRRKKRLPRKVLKVIGDQVKNLSVITKPTDVWMYLKDLRPTGPYSCLLCTQFFTNRFKLVVHYILDHKKDFCGICRYFVPNREAWIAHQKEHSPWLCSQCTESFEEEFEMRNHLRETHNLVHCKLCHFQVSNYENEYYNHLNQKHNVKDAACIEEEILWEVVHVDVQKFHCFLCNKSNILGSLFYNHFMALHHANLKCLTNMLSGKDLSLKIPGIQLSQQFIMNELKSARFGYEAIQELESQIPQQSLDIDHQNSNLDLSDIKHEVCSEDEPENGMKTESDEKKEETPSVLKDYKGDEDFDITAIELIMMEKCYYEYAENTLDYIKSNTMPNVNIDFEKVKTKYVPALLCTLCNNTYERSAAFALHFSKMHGVKCLPIYGCRMCSTIFESRTELDSHLEEEKLDFKQLWLCQFCDKEFDDRQSTRAHLLEHQDKLEYDNCFSPHLGFKCRYCPTLFWNEPDREIHQLKVHSEKLKNQHYKCQHCFEVFSEKMWFIHHYLTKHDLENPPTYMFKCTLCCLTQTSIDNMRIHFERNHPEYRKYYCSLGSCKYKPLSTKKSLGGHVRTVHCPSNKPERKAKCNICDKEFPNGRSCHGHMVAAHGPGKFKCKVCNEYLQTRDERKLHYMIRHPGHHPFECNQCDKSFMYKSTLYMHKKQHGDQNNYTCSFCAKVFNKKDSFREHLQIHGGARHACSYCPMKFVQRSNMLRHERRHTGERPYACQLCPRTFADKGACNSHTRTHLKLAPFICVYCGQKFAQKSKLTYHVRKHTGENLETCTVCSKLFTSACSLREHMKTHGSNRGTVKCPVCGNGYRDERYMLRHMRTSHSRNKYACPICKRAFSTHSAMKQHVWSHSKINAFKCKYCSKSYSIQRTVMKHLKRRHANHGPFSRMQGFFERIDPRDCGFDLDEETILSVFGPRIEKTNENAVADFVAITNSLLDQKARKAAMKSANKEENTSEDDNEDNDDTEDELVPVKEVERVDIKAEPKSDDGGYDESSFEPSDFVSVKIEPLEDGYGYSD